MLLREWHIIVQIMEVFEDAYPEGIGSLGGGDFTTWVILPNQAFGGPSGQILLQYLISA